MSYDLTGDVCVSNHRIAFNDLGVQQGLAFRTTGYGADAANNADLCQDPAMTVRNNLAAGM